MRQSLWGKRLTLCNHRIARKYSIVFVLVSGTELNLILGVSAIQAMKLIATYEQSFVSQITIKCSDIVEPLTKEHLKQQYPTMFDDLGKLQEELHLRIDATLHQQRFLSGKLLSLK